MGGTGVVDRFLDVFTRYIDSGFGLLGGELGRGGDLLIAVDRDTCRIEDAKPAIPPGMVLKRHRSLRAVCAAMQEVLRARSKDEIMARSVDRRHRGPDTSDGMFDRIDRIGRATRRILDRTARDAQPDGVEHRCRTPLGSSKLPIVSPMVLALTRSENRVVPQLKQKPRRIPGDELNQPIGPFRPTLSSGTMTRA